MNKIDLQRFWLLKILRNVKFTSKYCILLLKRFKTWLFSDPSCWSELVWNWDPPKTTEWRQLTLCPFWLIFEFENLARLSFLKFPIGSICRPQNWKPIVFFRHYPTPLPELFVIQLSRSRWNSEYFVKSCFDPSQAIFFLFSKIFFRE